MIEWESLLEAKENCNRSESCEGFYCLGFDGPFYECKTPLESFREPLSILYTKNGTRGKYSD